MNNYELGFKDPKDLRWEHKPQADFLDTFDDWVRQNEECDDEEGLGILFLNFIGGRGASKTTSALMLLTKIALIKAPSFRSAWTARTNGEIDTVLIAELERMVPSSLYSINNKSGARSIRWITGHETFLISRSVDNPKKINGLGQNIIVVFHDEAASGYLDEKFQAVNNAVREPDAPFYAVITTSTPLPNGYQVYCEQDDSVNIVSSSYQNPHIKKKNLDSMSSRMDKRTVQQEIYGKFVLTTGRQWDDFEEKAWPDGNILEGATYDPEKPFFIGADLGSGQSAYQIIQYFEPLHPVTGRVMFDGKLAVAVAELVPNQMDLPEVTKQIIDSYCDGDHTTRAPVAVCVGHDVNTAGNVGGTGAELFKQLGWKWVRPKGSHFRKSAQKLAARSLILNTKGERRFAVAATKNKHGRYVIDKQHFGEGKMRGILNVMRNDTYSDNDDKVFIKDKGKVGKNALEDDRDAFLYWVACNHPLNFNKVISKA